VERHYLLNRSETIDSVTSQLDTSAIYCFDSFDILYPDDYRRYSIN